MENSVPKGNASENPEFHDFGPSGGLNVPFERRQVMLFAEFATISLHRESNFFDFISPGLWNRPKAWIHAKAVWCAKKHIWAHGHMRTWACGCMGTWAYGHMGTRIRAYGHMGIWALGHMGTLAYGHWAHGHMGIERMGMRAYGQTPKT